MAKINVHLKRDMLQAYVKDVNKTITRRIPKVKFALADIVFNSIYTCPEMESIRGGTLRLDFGIVQDPTFEIAASVSKSINVIFDSFKYTNGSIVGGVAVNIQPADYLNLVELPSAFTITEDGTSLPWLEWLLKYGDNVIIINFGVKYIDAGRTGGAIMSKSTKPFRVDPRYSGTVDDNFIVRALKKYYREIEDKIWQTILN